MIDKSSYPWGAFSVYQNHLDQVLEMNPMLFHMMLKDTRIVVFLMKDDARQVYLSEWAVR